MAASACLSFLTHTQPLPITPFGIYAIGHWPFHSQQCSDQAPQLLNAFLGTSSCPGSSYKEWLRVALNNDELVDLGSLNDLISIPPNPLVAAAYFGLAHCADLWKPSTFDTNFRNKRGRSLLWLAAEQGKLEVIELLFTIDANIEITEAVVAAAAGNRGGKKMIELLLARDPNIEITEAVVTVAAGNHRANEVMELLLARDPNIEITEAAVTASIKNFGDSLGNLLQKFIK